MVLVHVAGDGSVPGSSISGHSLVWVPGHGRSTARISKYCIFRSPSALHTAPSRVHRLLLGCRIRLVYRRSNGPSRGPTARPRARRVRWGTGTGSVVGRSVWTDRLQIDQKHVDTLWAGLGRAIRLDKPVADPAGFVFRRQSTLHHRITQIHAAVPIALAGSIASSAVPPNRADWVPAPQQVHLVQQAPVKLASARWPSSWEPRRASGTLRAEPSRRRGDRYQPSGTCDRGGGQQAYPAKSSSAKRHACGSRALCAKSNLVWAPTRPATTAT